MIGVASVQTWFAMYLIKKPGIYPKEIWDLDVIFSTSVAKIQTKDKKRLQKMYGYVPLYEMYTATDRAFWQQKMSSLLYV